MPLYSIGAQSFIEANRLGTPGATPELIRQEIEVFQRPGVHGSAIRKNGVKGVPFQVRSCAYALTAADAWLGFNAYRNMIGTGPLAFVFEGKDFGETPFQVDVMVLHVAEFEVHKVYGLVVDGTVVGTAYLGYATWDLLPVAALSEEE